MSNDHTNKVSTEDIYYFRERTRNRIFSVVISAFSNLVENCGLTKRELAFRLGKEPSQITRWLSGPGNLTIDTMSDLLLGMGVELDYKPVPLSQSIASDSQHPLMRDRKPQIIRLPIPEKGLPPSTSNPAMANIRFK